MRPLYLCLACTLLCCLAALWLAPAVPATAQTPVATPTVQPTVTPTDAELLGVAPQIEGWAALWQRYGWWSLLVVLILALLWFFSALGEGAREAIKEWGKRLTERPIQAIAVQQEKQAARQAQKSGVETYLEWLRNEESLRYLPIIPISDRQHELLVENVYVPLRVVERDQIEGFRRLQMGEFDAGEEYRLRQKAMEELERSRLVYRLLSQANQLPNMRAEQGQPDPDAPALPPATTERLLLIGDAGSGKTTTLHYGALLLARDYLANSTQAARKGLELYCARPLLPFYVRLTLVATYVRKKDARSVATELPGLDLSPPGVFTEWLNGYLHEQTNKALPEDFASKALAAGDCLVLLDGLDETGDANERDYMQRLIVNLAQAYPKNRYLVASRPFAGLNLLGFADYHLSPLNRKEIEQLLRNWFAAMRSSQPNSKAPTNAEERIDYLLATLDESSRLFEMATNPLLLTTMALLIQSGTSLPRERVELYNRLVPLLIKEWRVRQLGGGRPGGIREDEDFYNESENGVRRRLQTLAAWMQENQRREVRLSEAQQELRPIYREAMRAQQWNNDQCDDHVAKLLHRLELHSGLIQGRDKGYSFAHYTLQEYMTARAYDEQPDGIDKLYANRAKPRWRETILLAIGYWATIGPPEKAQDLLQRLLASHEHNALLLAAAALDDAVATSVPELLGLVQRTTTSLHAIAFDPAACPDPTTRNRAAELLDRLGADTREALDPSNKAYWAATIQPGPFGMGEGDERFVYTIHDPYALARFPVTNRLYARFLASLPEDEARERRPRYWPGRSYRAGEGNHPVVGVTWYAATHFAAWANATWLTDEQRAKGYGIRLPTEPEWERAAAYPPRMAPGDPFAARRDYPWGPWEDLTNTTNGSIKSNIRANTEESELNNTSAVGIFPHGAAACGAEELAGNVWEWCSTPYQDYPLLEDLAAETIYNQGENVRRTYVLRGSSWLYDRSVARCGARTTLSPDLDIAGDGFRVARLFSLP
jgi:formylglycine-generating enzyme required for sulfatase activity